MIYSLVESTVTLFRERLQRLKVRLIGLLLFTLLGIPFSYTQPDAYYEGTEELKGAALKQRLHDIVKGHITFPYTSSATDVWDVLKDADKDPLNPENVILFYTGWTISGREEYRRGKGWTREHVWAKSHGDFGTDRGAGTDLHALRPADVTVNSARNNKDFDEGGVIYVDGDGFTQNRTDRDSWEPRDAVKGDVARSLFYMAVRYEGELDEPDLELVDTVNSVTLNEEGIGFHGKLSTLLKWHEFDPVDEYERTRHNIVAGYQLNRNPFIDHPEFVALIWDSLNASPFIAQYYEPAEGLEGEELREVLEELVNDHTEFSYTSSNTDIWDILKESDVFTDSVDRVELFYSGWSAVASEEFNSGRGWSREHVWDTDHGNFGTSRGAGTDAHAIRPVDITVGRARGDLDFDEGGNIYFDNDGPCSCLLDFDSFQPRPEKKGDVARMMFYMDLRYNGEDGEPDLVLVDTLNTVNYSNDTIGYHGKLSTLIQWHGEDPVDAVEKRRHEAVFRFQENRNPFIDHPEYVYALWDTNALEQYMPLIDTTAITSQLQSLSYDAWQMFPNPASSLISLKLELPPSETVALISIKDMQAKTHIQKAMSLQRHLTLDVGHLAPGIYVVSIRSKQFIGSKRLIIIPD